MFFLLIGGFMSSYNYDPSLSSIDQFTSIKSLLNKFETDAKENSALAKTDIEKTNAKVQELMKTYGDLSSAKGSLEEVSKDLAAIEKNYAANPKDKAVFKSPDFKKSILEKISFLQIEAIKMECQMRGADQNKALFDMALGFFQKGDLATSKAMCQGMTKGGQQDALASKLAINFIDKKDFESAKDTVKMMTDGPKKKDLEKTISLAEAIEKGSMVTAKLLALGVKDNKQRSNMLIFLANKLIDKGDLDSAQSAESLLKYILEGPDKEHLKQKLAKMG